MTILWSEIEAEAQGFRQGLVALYLKYEGQPTDEKDARNRPVKVTATSFARHMGVAHNTFTRWLKVHRGHGGTDASKQKTREIQQWHLRKALRSEPEAVMDAVAELPDEHQREIQRGIARRQLERAGADFSEAGRKGRQAAIHEHLEPIRQSLNVMQVVPLAEKLAEKLRNLPADLTEDDRREIDAAVDDVVLARIEMHMQAEVAE